MTVWLRQVIVAMGFIVSAFGDGAIHDLIAAATADIEKRPNDAELFLKRGELYSRHGEWIAAIADFDRAAALDPMLLTVDLFRGRLHFYARRYEEAVKTLDRFIEKKPDVADAFLTRARAKVQLQQFAAAADDYTRTIDLASSPQPEFFIERSQAIASQGPDKTREAVASLDEGILKLGPIVTLVVPLIELEVGAKHFDAALRKIDPFLDTQRGDVWLVRRGDILVKAGRPAEARAAYQSALEKIDTLPQRLRESKMTTELRAHILGQLRLLMP